MPFKGVLGNATQDWGKTVRLAFLFIVALGAGAIVIVIGFKKLGIRTEQAEQVEIDAGQAKFFLRIASNKQAQYVVLVHPQGWQDSGISLKKGDQVQFRAEGRTNIDLEGIVSRVQLRKKYELEIAKSHKIDRNSLSPNSLPEHYFTADQLKTLRPSRPWIGPDGDTATAFTSFRARVQRANHAAGPHWGFAWSHCRQRQRTRSERYFLVRCQSPRKSTCSR